MRELGLDKKILLYISFYIFFFMEIGLIFPSAPINGAVWGLWAFIFASILMKLCTRFSTFHSALIAWTTGFVLLWLAMMNMGVLPSGIIYWAAPWSFIEVYIAAIICSKILNIKAAPNIAEKQRN